MTADAAEWVGVLGMRREVRRECQIQQDCKTCYKRQLQVEATDDR